MNKDEYITRDVEFSQVEQVRIQSLRSLEYDNLGICENVREERK